MNTQSRNKPCLPALITVVVLSLIAFSAVAQDYPAPQEGTWVARDFRFHTGEVMPDLRLHYTTVGAPSGEPVLILHGTTGPARASCRPRSRASCSARANRSMRAVLHHPARRHRHREVVQAFRRHAQRSFPQYNYDDMVAAQYQLVTETWADPPPAPGARQLDGRHADLDLGCHLSGLHGCAGADGFAADRDVEPQLDDAAPDHRCDPQRSGLEGRQLHDAAARASRWPTCSSASPPTAARWPTRSWRPRASWPTSCSTSA